MNGLGGPVGRNADAFQQVVGQSLKINRLTYIYWSLASVGESTTVVIKRSRSGKPIGTVVMTGNPLQFVDGTPDKLWLRTRSPFI